MMLTGQRIIELVGTKEIVIDPFVASRVNPNSVNLTLDRKMCIYGRELSLSQGLQLSQKPGHEQEVCWLPNNLPVLLPEVLDPQQEPTVVEFEIPNSGWTLYPGILYLGSTVEYTETPNHVPCIEGRSSFGRLGISVHVTAGFGDVGFCGTWTLEITVVHPVVVYPGLEICQICYTQPCGSRAPYEGRYQKQRGPVPYRLKKEGAR